MAKLLLASRNPGKLYEMQSLLEGIGVQLVTPSDIGLSLQVKEDGKTYAENATRKALAFAQISGLLSLADDSGLEVEALDGAPGLYSARYAPKIGATDADRRRFLLGQLQTHARPWPAKFRCTVAVATPEGEVFHAEGICQGEIIPEERGLNGFGYDPVFLFADLGRTMAELSLEEKNRLSHRARAVQVAKPIILRLL